MKKALKGIIKFLIVLEAVHVGEWFFIGKKVAKAAGIPKGKALANCLTRGFVWWKPIKKSLEK